MLLTSFHICGIPYLRYLRPIGCDANITEIKTPLLMPNQAAGILAAIMGHLRSVKKTYDLIRWPDLPADYLKSEDWHAKPLLDEYIVNLDTNWQQFCASHKRNLKEAIRKAYNAAARNHVELTFSILESKTDLIARLPEFFRLHSARAQDSHGPKHRDYFSSEAERQFITNLIETSDVIQPRLFVVEHNHKVVAARLGFLHEQTLYLYFSGFDPAYGCYSVMTRLVVETMKYAVNHGIRRVNLSTGSDQSKLRWSPQCVEYRSDRHWSMTPRGQLLSKLYSMGMSLGLLSSPAT